jgi:hypothetical protein
LGPTSSRSACHSGSSSAFTAVSFIRRTEIGALAAIASASRSAVGRTSSAGTSRLTRPHRSATSLVTYSPV